jgi:hypothetical protein
MSDNTTITTLSEGTWASLGLCPALVAVSGGEAYLFVSDTAPSTTSVGFLLRPNDVPLSISATGTMWAVAISAIPTAALALPIG